MRVVELVDFSSAECSVAILIQDPTQLWPLGEELTHTWLHRPPEELTHTYNNHLSRDNHLYGLPCNGLYIQGNPYRV